MTVYLASNTQYLQQVQSLNVYIRPINAHHHVISLASFFAQRSGLRTVKFASHYSRCYCYLNQRFVDGDSRETWKEVTG